MHWKFLTVAFNPLTICLFLNFQGDSLSRHLQQVDGLTQGLPFQAAAVDSQDPVSDVDRAGSETPRSNRKAEIIPVCYSI